MKRLNKFHAKEPRYGVRRIAIELHWSEEKTRRIRNLAGIKALRRKDGGYTPRQHKDTTAPDNKLKLYWEFKDENNKSKGYTFANLTDPELKIWVQDFTYIKWHRKWFFLAIAMRLSSRKVVEWELRSVHDAELVCGALEDGLRKEKAPDIAHNDQGSEYLSFAFADLCKEHGITPSASDAGSPWQNGFMESFFNTFKEEMTDKMKQAKNEAELYVMVAQWIYYYNNKRIHTSLKMAPAQYEDKLTREKQFSTKEKRSKKENYDKEQGKSLLEESWTCPAL